MPGWSSGGSDQNIWHKTVQEAIKENILLQTQIKMILHQNFVSDQR